MSSDNDTNAHPSPVVVATYGEAGEAEVALAHLRSAGIEGMILDDTEGGAIPIEGEDGVQILVRPADAADAKALLTPIDEDEPPNTNAADSSDNGNADHTNADDNKN